jgi:hypothetical protein
MKPIKELGVCVAALASFALAIGYLAPENPEFRSYNFVPYPFEQFTLIGTNKYTTKTS